MLKINLYAIAIIIFATFVGSSDVFADSCKNVKFTVRNDRNGDIEIKKVSYFNQNENRWQDEDVPNTLIRRGQTITFGKEDLRDSAGDNITKLKFVYEDKNSRDTRESAVFVPITPKCIEEKNFGFGQGWAITGSSPVDETTGIFSSDSCKNVSFRIWNKGDANIEIKKVKYYNKTEGNWKTEELSNKVCPRNDDGNCTFGFDNLGSAEGDDLTKIVFVYEDLDSAEVYDSKEFVPVSPRCVRDKTYGFGQVWEIKAPRNPAPKGLKGDCENITFEVTNGTNKHMRIESIKYYNQAKGKWKSEGLIGETYCAPGEKCYTNDADINASLIIKPSPILDLLGFPFRNPASDLGGANGDDITKIKFVYKTSAAANEGYSAAKESQIFVPETPRCTEGKQYGLGQGWTIGGK